VPRQAPEVSPQQRELLERWLSSRATPPSVSRRARIVLLAGAGGSNREVARRLGVSCSTVSLWLRRFEEGGAWALTETKPGRGRKPKISQAKVNAIVKAGVEGEPRRLASCRAVAKEHGVSPASVHRLWEVNGIRTRRRGTPVGNAPGMQLAGLYLGPPDRLVALDLKAVSRDSRSNPLRTQNAARPAAAALPDAQVRLDSLFKSLRDLDGSVVGRLLPRHRRHDLLAFLRALDQAVQAKRSLHLIIDSRDEHLDETIRSWVAARPRFDTYAASGSDWLDIVEQFIRRFGERGDLAWCEESLAAAIETFLADPQRQTAPFTWIAARAVRAVHATPPNDGGVSSRITRDRTRSTERRAARNQTRNSTTAARRSLCQRYLLQRYVFHGDVEAAIRDLIVLSRRDPAQHRALVGRDLPYSARTYRRYWQLIDHEEREFAARCRKAGKTDLDYSAWGQLMYH
jgi:transposase